MPQIDERWESVRVTEEFLTEKAEWLRAPRQLHGSSVRFFELAGTLVLHARYDYPLASLAFFQAVIGLECALKLHYRVESGYLGPLLAKAVEERIVHDSLFSSIPKISNRVLKQIAIPPSSHVETLAVLVPELRNQFFHGTYLLAPDYLFFSFQLREIADALRTKTA